jgi:hypothetical protein
MSIHQVHMHPHHPKEALMAKTQEREKALAWIARQLRWERTLADLRTDLPEALERKAA